jgi:hypothetical protein
VAQTWTLSSAEKLAIWTFWSQLIEWVKAFSDIQKPPPPLGLHFKFFFIFCYYCTASSPWPRQEPPRVAHQHLAEVRLLHALLVDDGERGDGEGRLPRQHVPRGGAAAEVAELRHADGAAEALRICPPSDRGGGGGGRGGGGVGVEGRGRPTSNPPTHTHGIPWPHPSNSASTLSAAG